MTFPEYGRLIQNAPALAEKGSYPEFGEVIEPVSRVRSLAGAPVKGALKRLSDYVELVQKVPFPKGELKPEMIREFAESKFPTQSKEPEKILERAGGLGLESLFTPGGPAVKAAQVGIGTALGYGAEKLGAPPLAQAIAESLPFFFKGGKKIPLKKSQKDFGEFLRKQGLTENQITPLLKSDEQIARWSALAQKGGKSKKLVESIYQKTAGIYDSVIDQAKNLPPLSEEAKSLLMKDMDKIFAGIPNKFRSLIEKDFKDLLTKGRAGGEDLINFFTDINMTIGPEAHGKAILGLFKGPLNRAIESISPELADNYRLTRDFYRTRTNVAANIINKKDLDNFIDAGELLGLGAAVYNRDLGTLSKVIGAAGGRKLAREMLINPRLQNISTRVGEALKKNKLTLAGKLMREFKDEVAKEDPDLASTIP